MRIKLSPDVQRLNGLGPTLRTDGGKDKDKPRRAPGEGTMSRTSALNELAGHGWRIYASDDRTHRYTHASGRVVEAESYDALLNMLLKEARGT
jgi:hypothetical protein